MADFPLLANREVNGTCLKAGDFQCRRLDLAYVFDEFFNLETAGGSQKSAQALGAPGKIQKCFITTEVTTTFCISPCTLISYTAFLRPSSVSRFKKKPTWIPD